MTKKEICLDNKSYAYYSGFNGLELRYLDIDNGYIYYMTNMRGSSDVSESYKKRIKYHKSKLYFRKDDVYFKCNGYKVSLNDCVMM